jgi:hypothetical protein
LHDALMNVDLFHVRHEVVTALPEVEHIMIPAQ